MGLEGGWTVHKTQEDEEEKMKGQNGGMPKQMVKAAWREGGGTERMKLKSHWQHMHHGSNSEAERLKT